MRHVVDRELLDAGGIDDALNRLAGEIGAQPEVRGAVEPPILVGVVTGGAILARRLQGLVAERIGRDVELGEIDIALYRDDVFAGLANPVVQPAVLPETVDGRVIVLVDDVLFTGRTVRAALDELIDFGRPKAVRLAVLVDRGLRELPVRADYVGICVLTTAEEQVQVQLRETEETDVDRVIVLRRNK